MGAFKINNVIPGPTIDPAIILRVGAIMVMASLTMFIMGFSPRGVFIRILRLPRVVFLPPIVMVLTTIGVVQRGRRDQRSLPDAGRRRRGLFHEFAEIPPIAPLVIGVILGGLSSMKPFRRSLLISGGAI